MDVESRRPLRGSWNGHRHNRRVARFEDWTQSPPGIRRNKNGFNAVIVVIVDAFGNPAHEAELRQAANDAVVHHLDQALGDRGPSKHPSDMDAYEHQQGRFDEADKNAVPQAFRQHRHRGLRELGDEFSNFLQDPKDHHDHEGKGQAPTSVDFTEARNGRVMPNVRNIHSEMTAAAKRP